MSLTPNQQGVGRLLRFLDNSYVLARQEANNDEVIRIAPVLLRALLRLMAQGEIGSVQICSSADRTKPRNLFGQTSYLQSDPAKGVSPVDGIEPWLDQEVQPGGTRRSLLEQADAYFGDGSYPFIVPIGSHKSDRSGALPMRSPALGRSRPTPQTGATDGPCGGVPLRNVWVPRHHGLAADRCTGRIHCD